MKLLKDYSIEVVDGYTVVKRDNIVSVVEPGTVGYYSERFNPVKTFERVVEEYDGRLIEDAKYLDKSGLVEYRIGIKFLGDSYAIVDEYPGSLEYARNMISYYRKTVYAPKWVAFSTVNSRFYYCSGDRIYSVVADGGVTEYAGCMKPVDFLISTHFSGDVVSIPPNVTGIERGNCFGANPHPLERAEVCRHGKYYYMKVWHGDKVKYCFYDGEKNYLCAPSFSTASDSFERYLKEYDLFWVGNGTKVVLKKVADYYVSIGGNEYGFGHYRKLVDEVSWLMSMGDFMFAVFYGGSVYFVFGLGIVYYDGEMFLYSKTRAEDVYDVMKTILGSRFVPAEDPEEAYLMIHDL